MNSDVEPNPYAPPSSASHRFLQEDWGKGSVWRDGNKMIIGENAELPPRCFLTGEDTDCAIEIRTTWPSSHFGLSLTHQAIRDVKLNVPIARRILLRHLKKARFAAIAIVLLIVVGVVFVVSTVEAGIYPGFLIVAVGAFVLALFSLRVASSDPLRLHIEQLTADALVLRQLHP